MKGSRLTLLIENPKGKLGNGSSFIAPSDFHWYTLCTTAIVVLQPELCLHNPNWISATTRCAGILRGRRMQMNSMVNDPKTKAKGSLKIYMFEGFAKRAVYLIYLPNMRSARGPRQRVGWLRLVERSGGHPTQSGLHLHITCDRGSRADK